jgi:hypothetical protein
MSHPIVTTVSLVAAVANGIATSQSLGAAGPLTLNGSKVTGGVAVLDAPRRVIITSAGNDSGITWTITGTRGSWWAQQALTETIQGANGVAQSTQDFLTVSSIVGSGATASTVTAGTNGAAAGPWVVWSRFATDFQVTAFGTVLSGSPTWSLEYTYDDVFGLWLPVGVPFPRALQFGPLTGITGSADGALTNGCTASRLALTAVGSVQMTQQQQGN